jgi:hypothetical protein
MQVFGKVWKRLRDSGEIGKEVYTGIHFTGPKWLVGNFGINTSNLSNGPRAILVAGANSYAYDEKRTKRLTLNSKILRHIFKSIIYAWVDKWYRSEAETITHYAPSKD